MSGIFFTGSLSKTSSNGPAWDKIEVSFARVQIFANVLLSEYSTQTPESFSGFQPSWARSWIVTPETPTTSIGGISVQTRFDNTVYVKTNKLTFHLQTNNGGSANPAIRASAVGVIYDTTPSADFSLEAAIQQLELAVHEEDGTVVGTHRSFRLDGGAEIDEDETRERVLAEAYAGSDRLQGSLKVATFGYNEMPTGTDFRVDPSTGAVVEGPS